MVAARQLAADRLSRAVREQQTAVVPEHRVPNRGIHANARGTPSENQFPDPESAQDAVQVSLEETAEPVLVELNVFRLGSKLGDHLRVPRVANQESSRLAVNSCVWGSGCTDNGYSGSLLRWLPIF